MVVYIIKFLSGFVEFSVSGDFPERFLNQLVAHRVPFWDIQRKGGRLTLKVLLRDYKKLHKIKGKNRIKTKVVKRYGLPFKLRKYRLRVGFALGFVLYFAMLFYMSSFVWNINVVGNERIPTAEVLSACAELGLLEGTRISSVDSEDFRTRLALALPDIAWASVNIEGSTATVNISESLSTEKTDKTPCNLVASNDGIIERLEVTEGTVAVKVGQTVKAGDLLVSGVTEYKDGSSKFGRSSGKVFARTERTITYMATFVQSEQICVGEPKSRTVLSFFGIDIPLYLGSLKGNFERTVEVKRWDWNGAYLPITLTTAEFVPVDTRAFLIDEAVARELATVKLKEIEESELSAAEILSKNVEYKVLEKGVEISATYSLRENIAEQDLLLILTEK